MELFPWENLDISIMLNVHQSSILFYKNDHHLSDWPILLPKITLSATLGVSFIKPNVKWLALQKKVGKAHLPIHLDTKLSLLARINAECNLFYVWSLMQCDIMAQCKRDFPQGWSKGFLRIRLRIGNFRRMRRWQLIPIHHTRNALIEDRREA